MNPVVLDGRLMQEAAAALAAVEGVHTLQPDEILMRMEEVEDSRDAMLARCACVCSLLQTITRDAESVVEIRDRVAFIVSQVAPQMLPARGLWKGRAERARAKAAAARVHGLGASWDTTAALLLLNLLLKVEDNRADWSAREVGKRALLLLYAVQSNRHQRPAIAQSFETIGRAIGLKAANKRSAPSAAMQAMMGDLFRRLALRDRPNPHVKLWFEKSDHCREALEVSMKGKKNRMKKKPKP